ncbi:MAG: DUF6308 family protein [Acidimicrobiales bacterium]
MTHFSFGGNVTVSVSDALALVTRFPANTVERYDFGPSSGPNAVTSLEVGQLVAGEMVGLSMSDASQLVERAKTAPWHWVPIDARLEDALPTSDLYQAACELYDHFNVPNIKDAKISKLLHRKRPSLIPILDSVAIDVYREAANVQGSVYSELSDDYLYWEAIRLDISQPENIDAVAELRIQLRTRPSVRERLLATLSTLRLRDMILIEHQRR